MINDLEKKVLQLLEIDARYSPEKIAKMIGESREVVEAIIENFENTGGIVKYSAILNMDKIENNLCEALIEIKVSPQKSRGFDAIAEEILKFKEVTTCYLMSGGFDLTVFVKGKNIREVGLFVSEKLAVLEGVLATGTHFILKKYKIEGVNIQRTEEQEREILF